MKIVATLSLYLAAVVSLAYAGDIAYAAHYQAVMAGNGQAAPWNWTDVGAIAGIIALGLGIVSTALHIIAPRTKTKLDDVASEKIDGVLEIFHSPQFTDLVKAIGMAAESPAVRKFILGKEPGLSAVGTDKAVKP